MNWNIDAVNGDDIHALRRKAERLKASVKRLTHLEQRTREEWAEGEAGPSDAEWLAAWQEARDALAETERSL